MVINPLKLEMGAPSDPNIFQGYEFDLKEGKLQFEMNVSHWLSVFILRIEVGEGLLILPDGTRVYGRSRLGGGSSTWSSYNLLQGPTEFRFFDMGDGSRREFRLSSLSHDLELEVVDTLTNEAFTAGLPPDLENRILAKLIKAGVVSPPSPPKRRGYGSNRGLATMGSVVTIGLASVAFYNQWKSYQNYVSSHHVSSSLNGFLSYTFENLNPMQFATGFILDTLDPTPGVISGALQTWGSF